jgi:hypothetical protein
MPSVSSFTRLSSASICCCSFASSWARRLECAWPLPLLLVLVLGMLLLVLLLPVALGPAPPLLVVLAACPLPVLARDIGWGHAMGARWQ